MDEGYRTQSIPYTMCSWIRFDGKDIKWMKVIGLKVYLTLCVYSWIRFDGKDIKWMKVIGLKVYLTLCVAGSGSMGRT